jgi:hypothetical protein
MGCPALGVWVAFLKQPSYITVTVITVSTQNKNKFKKIKVINTKSQMNQN